MKQLKPAYISKLKQKGCEVPRIDYTMNTCYFRTVLNGETICASVDPRLAAKAATTGAIVEVVEL